MTRQTQRGIAFQDPELWKDAVIQFAVILLTGIWGTIHMALIRRADQAQARDQGQGQTASETLAQELREADAELGRLRAQLAEAQAVRLASDQLLLSRHVTQTDLSPTV